jgi:hypothetical protein
VDALVELSRCAAVWFVRPIAKRRGRRSDCSCAGIRDASESARTPAACHRSTRPTTVLSMTGFSIFARKEHPPILLGGRFGRNPLRGFGGDFLLRHRGGHMTVGGILVNRPGFSRACSTRGAFAGSASLRSNAPFIVRPFNLFGKSVLKNTFGPWNNIADRFHQTFVRGNAPRAARLRDA